MTVAKVRIDMQLGVFELEGEHDFVGTYLDKLLPVLESRKFVPRSPAEEADEGSDAGKGDNGADSADGGKNKRKASKRAPAGSSCRDRILTLKVDGFFKDHRTPSDIVTALGQKGWTHNVNQVSAALGQMFEGGQIQRTKNTVGKGFIYFWDRD